MIASIVEDLAALPTESSMPKGVVTAEPASAFIPLAEQQQWQPGCSSL
jgi:hypothetical protein